MGPEVMWPVPVSLAANAVTIPVQRMGSYASGGEGAQSCHRASGKPMCSHSTETQGQGQAVRSCLQAPTAVPLGDCPVGGLGGTLPPNEHPQDFGGPF